VCAQALDRAHLFEAERSARTEAAEANRRLQMLSEASKAFAESNRDFSSALGVIAQSLTEMVGDSATIALISLIKGDGTVMENVAARAKDPEFAEELKAFAREHPQRLGQGLRGRVAATGEAVFIPVVDKEQLREEIEPDYKPIFNRFKLSSIIVVPLRAHERILGTISLSRADPRRPLTAADLSVVQELADRAALTIENARLYESSQRAIRVRDHMLALAAHELATPLTVLRLQLSSLQRSELGAERSASKLEMATRCLERLDNVIDKFLDISCISAGQLALTPEPVDLSALVRDVCELFSERLARSECELDLHAEQSVVGRWDKLRLEQVVTNLLSNACKFGRGKPIEVSVGSHGDMAFVQVRDNGIGIPPDKQARIFERLEHVVAQRDQSGLRLGLWICRELVEAQGGKISVESEPGVGSTFTVYLPWNGPRGGPRS
jgi:signal transduction histidine kinase